LTWRTAVASGVFGMGGDLAYAVMSSLIVHNVVPHAACGRLRRFDRVALLIPTGHRDPSAAERKRRSSVPKRNGLRARVGLGPQIGLR
jgi:hypothetical protein